MNLLIGLALVAMAVGLVAWLRRKTRDDASLAEPVAAPKAPLMQIVLHDNACKAARQLESIRFDKSSVPILPLSACDNPESCRCRCRYVPVEDRRSTSRRSGNDKRLSHRYEETPRRKDRGRRAGDNTWTQDQD